MYSGRFDSGLMEFYLERADMAGDSGEWQALAEFGVQTVLAKWESAALLLAGEGFDIGAAREELETDLAGLLEERLTQWLVSVYFEGIDRVDLRPLVEAVDAQNRSYLYTVDAGSGALVRDEAGDPVLQTGDPQASGEVAGRGGGRFYGGAG